MSAPTTTDNIPDAAQQHMKAVALRAYRGQQQSSEQDDRIVSYLPMVHKIVQQVVGYVRPSISIDDLVSAGTIGLIKAARDFDPSKDAEFKTYAYIRIRGGVIDELRSWSFTPPEVGKQMAQIERICHQAIEQGKPAPTDEEIAHELGITTEKLYKVFDNARAGHFLSMSGLSEDASPLGNFLAAHTDAPGDNLERAELSEQLARAIEQLPQKQKHLIVLYYNQQLTMKQIAQVLNLTESRVSQLHASALAKLSALLGASHGR